MVADEQLAVRAAAGDELAFRTLRTRHRGLIFGIAKKRYAPGVTGEDFAQEAQIAFWKSVVDYDPSTGIPFGAFANLVVTRHVDTALRAALRGKHRPVNEALSLDAPVPGTEAESTLAEAVPSRAPSAFDALVQRADVAAVVDTVGSVLSSLEREAVIGRAAGESYLETEARLGIANDGAKPKGIDNALQRARVKIADALGVDRFPLVGVAA